MGSPTSTRWNNHKRAALVEDTPSISVVELRRAGLLDGPGATFTPVHHPVQAPVALEHLAHHPPAIGRDHQVGVVHATGEALLELDTPAGPPHHVSAPAAIGEVSRDSQPDAAGGAGDQGDGPVLLAVHGPFLPNPAAGITGGARWFDSGARGLSRMPGSGR